MYNRFIFKIDVSRTAHTIRPYWLSSCSHYPIIIDGVFIQISSVARFTGCCGENTPLAPDDDYDDTVFLRLPREICVRVIHTTNIHAHNISICIYSSDTLYRHSGRILFLPMRFGVVYTYHVYKLYRRSIMIILMCAVFIIIFFFFNEHIFFPTAYLSGKGKKNNDNRKCRSASQVSCT